MAVRYNRACALEKIEFSIHLISVNATIKTAQLGDEGVGMGVIASELQSITRESENDTRVVLDQLAAINEALTKIGREEAISESSVMMAGDGNISPEVTSREVSIREVGSCGGACVGVWLTGNGQLLFVSYPAYLMGDVLFLQPQMNHFDFSRQISRTVRRVPGRVPCKSRRIWRTNEELQLGFCPARCRFSWRIY